MHQNKRNKLEKKYKDKIHENPELGKLISYTQNRKVPLLRLFRYKEAFSLDFVNRILHEFQVSNKDIVFDPFCGMGTTMMGSYTRGIRSIGTDQLPLPVFISQTLIDMMAADSAAFAVSASLARALVEACVLAPIAEDVKPVQKGFSTSNMRSIKKWKTAIAGLPQPQQNMMKLLLLSVLEECSGFIKDGAFLRFNKDKKTHSITEALSNKVKECLEDLEIPRILENKPLIQLADARKINLTEEPTFVITSPPYLNRYNYVASYSLELAVGFVDSNDQLKQMRDSALRSHIESKVKITDRIPHDAIEEVLDALRYKELNNERIPSMIITYFADMEQVIQNLANVCAKGATIVMVIDNVRYAGEHIPVDLILCDLAENFSFQVQKIEVARYKGNSSQQMKTYGRFPVRESVLVWTKTS